MDLLARGRWNGKVPIPESCTEHRKVIECSKAVAVGLRQPGNWPCGPSQRGVFSCGAAVLGTGSPTYDRFLAIAVSESSTSISNPRHFAVLVGLWCWNGPSELFWDDRGGGGSSLTILMEADH